MPFCVGITRTLGLTDRDQSEIYFYQCKGLQETTILWDTVTVGILWCTSTEQFCESPLILVIPQLFCRRRLEAKAAEEHKAQLDADKLLYPSVRPMNTVSASMIQPGATRDYTITGAPPKPRKWKGSQLSLSDRYLSLVMGWASPLVLQEPLIYSISLDNFLIYSQAGIKGISLSGPQVFIHGSHPKFSCSQYFRKVSVESLRLELENGFHSRAVNSKLYSPLCSHSSCSFLVYSCFSTQ